MSRTESRTSGIMSDTVDGLSVESEVGKLEAVVVHTPGTEIESMTPGTAKGLLYNEIVPLAAVDDEHRALKTFLSSIADVREVTELLATALDDDTLRHELVDRVTGSRPANQSGPGDEPGLLARTRNRLLECEPVDTARMLVHGVPSQPTTLTGVLSGRDYDLPPLPNLYFTRDSAAVIRDALLIGAMAFPVRTTEALIMRAAMSALVDPPNLLIDGPDLRGPVGGRASPNEPYYSGRAAGSDPLTFEGGDCLVFRRDLLVIGVSERTSPAAIDLLALRAGERFGEPLSIIAVILPKERYAIHLDMVFTFVDQATALIYEPLFVGAARLPAYRIDVAPGAAPRISREEGALEALGRLGYPLELIRCGGSDPVAAQREQWLSAANVFAFGPGKVIGFDCNRATMESFQAAGYSVREISSFAERGDSVDEYGRLFVSMPGTNLARGGGGPRCMTMPVRRAALPA